MDIPPGGLDKPPVSVKQIDRYLTFFLSPSPFGSFYFFILISTKKPTMGAPFTAIRLSLSLSLCVLLFFTPHEAIFLYLFFISLCVCVYFFTHSHVRAHK
jgi:hypothetical protein